MIFSRTASRKDINDFSISDVLMSFLQDPSSVDYYDTSVKKFWEYSLLLKLINHYGIHRPNILVVYDRKKDDVLSFISDNHNLNLIQIDYLQFLKMKIRPNKYNIVCSFGTIDNIENYYGFIDKLQKHVILDGYLILTNDKNSNVLSVDDFITISYVLENLGYDFCSEQEDLVDYNDNGYLHSLVMKRIGN